MKSNAEVSLCKMNNVYLKDMAQGPIKSPKKSVTKPFKYSTLTVNHAVQSEPVETATRTLDLVKQMNNTRLVTSPEESHITLSCPHQPSNRRHEATGC